MKKLLQAIGLLAVLGLALFVRTTPAKAGGWTCWMPQLTYWETYNNFPDEDGSLWDYFCQPDSGTWGTGLVTDVTDSAPASINMYNNFATATIEGIPGTSFKAFMYTHWHLVPAPLPEGWNRYGYGVDIFYDNGNVNPNGFVCYYLPDGVVGNFELGIFSYKDGEYSRLSSNRCASFQGGGTFFLLIKNVDPIGFFLPPF